MTNSMIPYSFVPGTKAKASEVNANFIALADKIDANKAACNEDFSDIAEQLAQMDNEKADKTELINEHTVTEDGTDLDDYTTKGTYIFSTVYTPENIPKGTSGTLIVTGDEDSVIKQIWFCDGENPEIFTRNLSSETWSDWYSHCGIVNKDTSGYLKLTNGMVVQWGYSTASRVTFPIAFSTFVCPVFTKKGYGANYTRSDTGFMSYSLTNFEVGSSGLFYDMTWMAIGY